VAMLIWTLSDESHGFSGKSSVLHAYPLLLVVVPVSVVCIQLLTFNTQEVAVINDRVSY
jgi:hypothetical protein